jgi:hypothetical protein
MPVGVYKRTDFHIKRLSDSHKGRKRKPRTKEWSNKIRQSLTGRKREPFSIIARKNMSKSHKGEKCNFWKGGITPRNLAIRNSIEYRLWREAVFARDNWTCQKTGKRGFELHPHHIKNFAQYPELRFAIDNGITLSEASHKEFHRIYGKENNTKEQLEEFLNLEDVIIKHMDMKSFTKEVVSNE